MAGDTTKTFNTYSFTVTVKVDDDAYLDSSPFPEHSEAKDALQSEIRSNLESLDGVGSVTVKPTA